MNTMSLFVVCFIRGGIQGAVLDRLHQPVAARRRRSFEEANPPHQRQGSPGRSRLERQGTNIVK